MTSRDFVYWLQGYFEIMDPKGQGSALPIGSVQAQCIREHLDLVFRHELSPTPPAKGDTYIVPPMHHEPLSQETTNWLELMARGAVKVC
jgi:hypothetical protein